MQEIVTETLREAILRGQLKPGERLDQIEIAERLGVSRMPVREALRRLEAEGLVAFYPHRGVLVSDLSNDEIEEVFGIRVALEAMAVRLAIPRLTDDILQEMAGIVTAMEGVEDDPPQWASLNNQFHLRLYQASGRARLCSLIEVLRYTVQPYVVSDISLPEHARRAAQEHRELLEICRRGDLAAAEQSIRKHLMAVCNDLVRRSGD